MHRLPTRNRRPVLSSDSAVDGSNSRLGNRNTREDSIDVTNCGSTMAQLCKPVTVPVSDRKSIVARCNPMVVDLFEITSIPSSAYGTHIVTDHKIPSTLTSTMAPVILLLPNTGHVKSIIVKTNMTCDKNQISASVRPCRIRRHHGCRGAFMIEPAVG